MKSKRWKRRNRHTRPEWVRAWRSAEVSSWYYTEWHFPVLIKNQIAISDGQGFAWLDFEFP